MHLAVLYSRLSGYLAACLREFRKQTGAELLIFAKPAQPNAPFDFKTFADLGEIIDRTTVNQHEIEARLRAFKPDAVLVSGWADPAYNRICRRLKAEGIPIIAGCDTQWTGSLRQRVAGLMAPWHVRRFIDVLWVTGNRQRRLAEALGFRGGRCWEGYYACDWEAFAKNAETLKTETLKTENGKQKTEILKNCFLFAGRYVEEKGVRELVEAYALYRERAEKPGSEDRGQRTEDSNPNLASDLRPPSSAPWSLICAGAGPLRELLTAAGAQDRGFVPPENLPSLMREASCFVLPSRFEPWGVVVQEAAAAGLPLIVSDACGAGDHLVRDGQNGFVIGAGNGQHLATAMMRMHQLNEAGRQEFGRRSFELSKQYTPERWAKTLEEGVEKLKN